MCCRLLCRCVNSPVAGANSRQPQCAPPLEFANPRSKISNYPINRLSSVAAAGGCKAGSGLSISVAGNAMETPESSRTTGKKRARDEEADGDDEQGADETLAPESDLAFSDTLIALRMMHAQFPKVDKVAMKPFVLRSQLYSSVKDRTQVDRDLEALKKEKLLRLFKLNTGQDDHAIMFLNDYLEQMAIVLKRLEAKSQQNAEVFEWFKRHVIESNLDVSIKHQELCSLLSFGGEVNDKHVTLLINAGLLTRQLIDSNVYWFAIPNIGSLLKGLSQGRKELLSFMNRRKYKEMLLTPLEKKRLRLSPLDMRFHLRDLIGSGHLKTVQTPMGLLVQVSKD